MPRRLQTSRIHSVALLSSVACELAPLRIVLLCVFFLPIFTSLFARVTSAMIIYDKRTLLDIGQRYTNLIQDTLFTNPMWPLEILRHNEKKQRSSTSNCKDFCKSHHLQCIKSSKDWEKLEKSLCLRDKAQDIWWMPIVFGPSENTASLIGMILSLRLLNGPRNTSRNHCW